MSYSLMIILATMAVAAIASFVFIYHKIITQINNKQEELQLKVLQACELFQKQSTDFSTKSREHIRPGPPIF